MHLRHLVAATATAALIAPAFAGGVPRQALDKTITISFTSSGIAKSPGGKSHGFSVAVYNIIYVSSAGRLFRRYRDSVGPYNTGGDVTPGKGSASFGFHGDRLIGVIPWASGALQIIVTFDSSFSSCTASTIEGREASGVIRRQGPDGVMYEVTSASMSNPSCSIRSGNAFAGYIIHQPASAGPFSRRVTHELRRADQVR